MDYNIIIKELKKLNLKAIKNGDVPISALIVKDNKIIAKAYNNIVKTNNILNHAEIIAIRKATKAINNWRLNDCILYVTLEPCDMCKEIIKKSRIKEVIYFSPQNQHKTESNPIYNYYNYDDFSIELKKFFNSVR